MHFLRISTHLRRDEQRAEAKSLGRQYDLVPIRTDGQMPMNHLVKGQLENEQHLENNARLHEHWRAGHDTAASEGRTSGTKILLLSN